jgi:putative ABC transport system permease protein
LAFSPAKIFSGFLTDGLLNANAQCLFMMNKMIVSNLVHRPLRSAISIVAIALEVTLILLIVGLSLGMLNDSRRRQAGIGADVIVMPPGSSFIVGLTGAPMSIRVGDILAKLPHVMAVAPVVSHVSASGTLEVIAGIDLKSYERLSGPFHYLEGGPFIGPKDVLVDDLFARSKHVNVGDEIEVLNNNFRVAGIVEQGKGARKFLQIGVLQDLIGAKDKASIFYLKLDDPNNADAVVDEIKKVPGMEKYVATSMAYYLSMMTPSNYPGLSTFINVVIGISVIIGFIVIFQAMYTAVMERTREIGILKSMGASKLYIVNVILRETVLLAIGGIVVGIVFSLAARLGIVHRLPTLPVVVTGGWMLRSAIIAIVGAIAGALYPAYKAAQKDPIDALAYE